ncbi:hypothetical protein [Streptomyces sp. NPDC048825]|uniref:hypothetical protein n=1 Tax=Streptomyces sp. NPDC048825 TaxID=3365592 RepID=UPI003711F5A2
MPVAMLRSLRGGRSMGFIRWCRWAWLWLRAKFSTDYELMLVVEKGGPEWRDSPEGQAYFAQRRERQRAAADRRRMEADRWRQITPRERRQMAADERRKRIEIDAQWRAGRNAEEEAQAFLEVYESPLTAPAALSMAAALARRGKLDEANMRRAEELYEDRVKNASPDYWPTGESVVSLLFGRDQHP